METETKPTRNPARDAPHRRFFPIPRPSRAEVEIEAEAEAGIGPKPRPWPAPDLHPGEPETCRRDWRRFLPIWAHLALLLAVIKVYRVEGRALVLLTSIALAALPVHYLLPFRWKRPFFLAVSVVGLFAVFGLAAGLMVSALALAFIGASRLPVAWTIRAAIVAASAVALAMARSRLGPGSTLVDVALPVVGSMLMFRMILYFYEIKHAKRPEPLLDTLNYFFLLPNYAFVSLFPVVDYRTFGRSFLAVDVHEAQRSGVRMIFNGVVQLLAYRLVHDEGSISADRVAGPLSLAGYLVGNYLLYLRVSGQFHVACGMLHLFGYQLPRTHHNYLLATGFTDYWRRINIYWKDFMIRVVFNPVAFRLKRRPRWATLSVATVAVFLTTWLLHAYQMFWIRGSWGFSVPDGLFWGILGVLVLVNVQLDARRKPGAPGGSKAVAIAVRCLKTAGTFATIALLWSLWHSPSVGSWLAMLRRGLSV